MWQIQPSNTFSSSKFPVWKHLPGPPRRRYEMITCLDKNAVSSLYPLYTLHSELWWWFSRVIPQDPKAKMVWLWSAIETVTFELEIPWGSHNLFSFNTATVWGHTHNGMYKSHMEYLLMISYLFWAHSNRTNWCALIRVPTQSPYHVYPAYLFPNHCIILVIAVIGITQPTWNILKNTNHPYKIKHQLKVLSSLVPRPGPLLAWGRG